MAEYRIESTAGDPSPDNLEARLDALGRAVLSAEAVKAEPPAAYVRSARQRGRFARGRVWTARLAVAAAVVIGGITAAVLLRSTPPSGTAAPGPIAAADPARPSTPPAEPDTTLAEITAANRGVTSPEQLRLPAPAAAAAGALATSTMRASDSRSIEKIDAILSGK